MPLKYPQSPFYERDEVNKNYYKMLGIPGRVLQASEFTSLQGMMLDIVKSIGDSLFRDGNVLNGCDIILKDKEVTITSGRIYLDGVVRETEGTVITITGIGEESIGAYLEEIIITEDEDTTLLDPATGSSNAFQPGAYRVQQTVQFALNDPKASPIINFINGEIQNLVTERPQMDVVNEVLARRTYDESGNYVVNGFEMKDSEYSDEEGILISLSKGKAYIKGFEVNRPTDTTFYVNKSTTTRVVEGEPKTVNKSSNSYDLLYSPVNKVAKVFGTATVTETLVFDNLTNTYTLSHVPVASVISVKSNGDGTTHNAGTDYVLSGNKIVWQESGSKPSNGTNFKVNYTYKRQFFENTDYTRVDNEGLTSIRITAEDITESSELLIDYDYYLARKDTVCLDKEGRAIVVEGNPDDLEKVVPPLVDDLSILKIGSITIHPNSDEIIIVNNTIKVSTMEKIQSAIERIDDLEYNLTMTTLDQEFMSGTNVEQLRGMFTEAFVNFDRVDMARSDVNVSLDFDRGAMVQPHKESSHELIPSSHANNRYSKIGSTYTIPYTNKEVLSQNKVTKAMLVNPHQVFDPIMTIDLSPSVDNWIETSKVTVNQVNVPASQLNRWWRTAMDSWLNADQTAMDALGITNSDIANIKNQFVSRVGNVVTGKTNELILDQSIQYMRPTVVKISSRTFPFNANNIRCKFDGRHVNLTPLNTTRVGTSPGSVQADGTGLVEATFTVPPNVQCGTKEVILYDGNVRGYAQYTAEGRKLVIRETIFTFKQPPYNPDPLAQTFKLQDTCILTGIDLYFAVKDDKSVTVQIRDVVAGMPGDKVYSEVALQANDIRISGDGSVATHFTFPNPVQCDKDVEYCFVIATESPKMSAYIATLGERDLQTGEYLVSNPYTTGVMLSSSNASTWTPHQDSDIKFKLYKANFESKGEINFASISTPQIDKLLLAIESVISLNTGLQFQVSLNGGAYQNYFPWMDTELNEYANKVDVRLVMSSTNKNLSPFISSDTASIVGFKSELSATYISKNIKLPEACDTLKVTFNTSTADTTSAKVYYATDGTGTSWTELTDAKSQVLNSSTKQLEFTKSSLNIKDFRIKLVIATENSCKRPFINKLGVILNKTT